MNDSRLRRHELGFLQAVKIPSPQELKAYYAERYYQTGRGNFRKSYPQAELDYLNIKIAQKASVVNRLRAGLPPGTMLDVGCGEGFALAWFGARGWTVEGIDYSVDGLEGMNPGLLPHVEAGDVFELLDVRIGKKRQYDLVWLTHVLEHVADPVALLSAVRRLVSPEGVLVVTVPNDGTAYQEALLEEECVDERFWIALPDHLAYFTQESLRNTAEATGWDCLDILGDFPIDLFLLHEGSNYVRDRTKGPAAHQARIRAELLLGNLAPEKVNEFYSAMAQVGLGRSLTAFLTPESKKRQRR